MGPCSLHIHATSPQRLNHEFTARAELMLRWELDHSLNRGGARHRLLPHPSTSKFLAKLTAQIPDLAPGRQQHVYILLVGSFVSLLYNCILFSSLSSLFVTKREMPEVAAFTIWSFAMMYLPVAISEPLQETSTRKTRCNATIIEGISLWLGKTGTNTGDDICHHYHLQMLVG